jgi:hypothetical protein
MEIPKSLLDQIKEGNVVLFLGSGASFGALHPMGINPPIGIELSNMIVKKFLSDEFLDMPLQYTSEIAISEYNLPTVQNYIYEIFEPFYPNDFHRLIPNFVWKAIVSTNYDLIIEKAYQESRKPLQKLAKFIKNGERVRDKVKSFIDLPFYKLHGCITDINDLTTPLILTPDQYITHRINRERLYNRVQELAYEYPFLFIGFSFADSDIRSMLLEIGRSKDLRPRSFMVGPNIKPEESRLWENKKISSLKSSFNDFLLVIDHEIEKDRRSLALVRNGENQAHPIFEKSSVNLADLKPSEDLLNYLNQDVQYIYKRLKEVDTDAKEFYKGYFENWDPILKNFDCHRNIEDAMLTEIFFNEERYSADQFQFFLLQGYAGSGKSVLLKRLAWDAGIDFEAICLFYNKNIIIKHEPIIELCNFIKERIFIFIDNIADSSDEIISLIRHIRKEKLPITLIGAERVNTWNTEGEALSNYLTNYFKLHYLNDLEINELIEKLEKHDSLGYLTNKTKEERIQALSYKAGRELLVALYESTLGKPFSEIVVDEYNSLNSETAKSLYLTVSILHRLGTETRAGLISRVHNISFSEFKEKLFKPLEFIVFDHRDYRINDYVYTTRHRQIAEIVFEEVLSDKQHRYDEYARILSCLDVDYENDRTAFLTMTNAKNLNENFNDPNMIRSLYKIASDHNSTDPKLMQQEAIFEMISKGGNLNKAEQLLNKAIEIYPKDLVIQHSFAELAFLKAEKSKHNIETEKYLSESETICKKLISKSQEFPHPFHTLLKIQLFKLKRIIDEQDSPSIERAIKETEKTVSTAKQFFPEQEFILEAESQFNKVLNNRPEAIVLLEKAYELNPRSPYLCLRLANLYELNRIPDKAKYVLEKTLQNIPNDKDVNFKYAMILIKEENTDLENIKFYLRRAFTQGDNRHQAQFYFARTLYLLGERPEASKIFDNLKAVSLPPKIKSFPRGKVRQNGCLVKFKGTIQKIDVNYGFIIRDGFSDIIYFYRYESNYESIWRDLSSKPRVNFNLAFNYKGPVAVNIKIEKNS